MKVLSKLAVFTITMLFCAFAVTVSAMPPPDDPPTLLDIYKMLEQLDGKLDGIEGDVDDLSADLGPLQDSLENVSIELGSGAGIFYHSGAFDDDWQDALDAYVIPDSGPPSIVRWTITVGYDQEEVGDYVVIHASLDGTTWATLATLSPAPEGGGNSMAGRTTFTATFAARKIKIQSYNEWGDLTGTKPTVSWNISAVGPYDAGEFYCKSRNKIFACSN